MAWRLAKSLIILRDQINGKWPNRSKSEDGTIGDSAHAARASDHNPDQFGVVRAIDFTHDPAHGFDSYQFADDLRQSRDPRIKYIISNRRIASATVSPWLWRPYDGANAHDRHCHISVVGSSLADEIKPWSVIEAIHAPASEIKSGKGSWYSQYEGKYKWVDTGDRPGSAALGCPDNAQGISFLDHSTLGDWFEVTAPNGKTSIEQQTDIGPSAFTGCHPLASN